ncbi:MAG: metal-sensing transcriptional repressor [Dehalococcoidia bacterium]
MQKTIENGRACESVIIRLGAVSSAVEGVGGLILKNWVKVCLKDKKTAECGGVESLARAIAIRGKVHIHETD